MVIPSSNIHMYVSLPALLADAGPRKRLPETVSWLSDDNMHTQATCPMCRGTVTTFGNENESMSSHQA